MGEDGVLDSGHERSEGADSVWYRGDDMSAARRSAGPEGPDRAAAYSISELAREFALTTRAIRFYEDCGLVTPQRRGRARVYGERERVRIKLILRGKRLGLALSEIGELLDLYEIDHNERAQLAKFIALLGDRRARLLQQREDIDAVLAEIDGIERECRRRLKEDGQGAASAPRAPRAAATETAIAARGRGVRHN
jgi:DNA-binding transcriptional MerR regulator